MRAAFAVALFVALAVAGAGVQVGSAGNTSTKYYSTSLPLTGLSAGTSLATTVTLANSTTSTQSLGSEQIQVPAGFSVTPTSATGPSDQDRTWNLSVLSGNILQLAAASSGNALDPGHSVTFTITVNASCSAPLGSATWKSTAKQSNSFNGPPGNDFKNTGADPSSTVSGACSFQLSGITSPERAGTGFTVSIQALDGNGSPTANYSGTPTLSGNLSTIGTHAPFYGSATGAVTVTAGQGSANVIDYKAESGRMLSLSDGTVSGTSGTFYVDPGNPAALTWGTQPSDTSVGTAIAPAVTVNVWDAYGNKEDCTGIDATLTNCVQADVTLSPSTDPSPTTTLGGKTATSVNGTATFGSLTLDHSGTGFKLTASATYPPVTGTTFSSVESAPFTVYDTECNPADPYTTCSAGKNGTFITTDYPTATTDPTRFQLSGLNQNLPCGSLTTARGSLVTFLPAAADTSTTPYTYRNPIVVTLRWDKSLVPGTGVSNFTLCLAKPFDAPGWVANQYQVVQDCPAKLKSTTVLPCASKRSRNNAGDLVIVLLMGSGDPIAGLG